MTQPLDSLVTAAARATPERMALGGDAPASCFELEQRVRDFADGLRVMGVSGGLLSTVQVADVSAAQPGPEAPRSWYDMSVRGRIFTSARPLAPVVVAPSLLHGWSLACW